MSSPKIENEVGAIPREIKLYCSIHIPADNNMWAYLPATKEKKSWDLEWGMEISLQ